MNLIELQTACAEHGLQLDDQQLEKFEKYASFLVEYNKNVNLTAITKYEEIIEKHFYDSILPSFMIDIKDEICDVGAGAGFPSIPLKIAYPELKVIILEPLNKRCVFLEKLVELLELKDVKIKNVRAEDYAQDYRESYSLVTARAVANLSMLAELCIPLVKKDGIFLAMKGTNGKKEEAAAKNALKLLKVKREKIEVVTLSDDSTRVNIAYRKIDHTPKKYPRMFAKIKKSPL
jgi:16S rRNA (guanine527-N7)-methyltransferase